MNSWIGKLKKRQDNTVFIDNYNNSKSFLVRYKGVWCTVVVISKRRDYTLNY